MNPKVQSLLSALMGWIIGTSVMLMLGYESATSLLTGLVFGCPVGYIAYEPLEFWSAFKRKWATAQLPKLPAISLPRIDVSVSKLKNWTMSTLGWGLIVGCWALPGIVLVLPMSWSSASATPVFSFLVISGITLLSGFSAWGTVRALLLPLRRGCDDHMVLFLLPYAQKEPQKRLLAIALTPLGLGLIPLAFVALLFLLVGSFAQATLVVLAEICCSGRLIAMASTAIALIVGYQTQSVGASLGALGGSFVLQWVLHGTALKYRTPLSQMLFFAN